MKFLTFVSTYVPPNSGEAPPGTENLNTIVQWFLWGAAAVMFVLFIGGLVTAARARHRGGEADASAPVWPLITAVILGASGAIWAAIT